MLNTIASTDKMGESAIVNVFVPWLSICFMIKCRGCISIADNIGFLQSLKMFIVHRHFTCEMILNSQFII